MMHEPTGPASAAPMPDADLLALGREFEAACQAENEADVDAHVEEAVERAFLIVKRILAARAQSLVGLRIKARALTWLNDGEPVTADDLDGSATTATDTALVASIISDLGALL